MDRVTATPNIRIPAGHLDALREFARLPDEPTVRFVALLGAAPPVVTPDELDDRVAEEVPELVERTDLLAALMAMELLRASHGWSSAELAEAVAAADELELDPGHREKLARRLADSLATTSLAASAKTVGLETAQERAFHVVRIVTDVRPVFGTEVAEGPLAALIRHSLEFAFHGSSGRLESFWISLDDEDLMQIGNVVQRAETKSRALRAFLNAAGLRVVDDSHDDGGQDDVDS